MKRWRLILLLAVVLVLAGAGFAAWHILFPPLPPSPPALTELESLQLPRLAADARQAQKDLAAARQKYAKLKPAGPYIVINTHANLAYLRTEKDVLLQGVCSTGSGRALTDSVSGRKWIFNTPHGVFKINSKLPNPMWVKPDWAFIEEGERPPKDPRERYDENVMGDYAMGFGNGYYIHGTIYERLLGISVTHGCVRLGTDDLQKFYDKVKIGTAVYIF